MAHPPVPTSPPLFLLLLVLFLAAQPRGLLALCFSSRIVAGLSVKGCSVCLVIGEGERRVGRSIYVYDVRAKRGKALLAHLRDQNPDRLVTPPSPLPLDMHRGETMPPLGGCRRGCGCSAWSFRNKNDQDDAEPQHKRRRHRRPDFRLHAHTPQTHPHPQHREGAYVQSGTAKDHWKRGLCLCPFHPGQQVPKHHSLLPLDHQRMAGTHTQSNASKQSAKSAHGALVKRHGTLRWPSVSSFAAPFTFFEPLTHTIINPLPIPFTHTQTHTSNTNRQKHAATATTRACACPFSSSSSNSSH